MIDVLYFVLLMFAVGAAFIVLLLCVLFWGFLLFALSHRVLTWITEWNQE